MAGFCPHDWHGTTEADLQQMSDGDDYAFWFEPAALHRARRASRATTHIPDPWFDRSDDAQAIETRSATTAGRGPQDESAVTEGHAPNPTPDPTNQGTGNG